MNLSKTASTLGITAVVVAGSLLAVGVTSAHGGADDSGNRFDGVAQRLGVESSDLEAAFQAERTERHAEHEEQKEQRIQALIDDGTLTQEQADALTAKHAELKEAMQALKDGDVTKEEMHEQMQQAREEFKAWAAEQGIDLESIRPEGEHKGQRHGGGHRDGFGS